ncbi:MAG: recombinase family protein, partial [Nitrosotalea sp.]
MKTVLFCRVSSKEQEETGYSLPAQEKYLREYADKNGLEIGKVFAVSESASKSERRKVFKQLIDYIKKNGIPVVTVETTDRLLRNFADVPLIDKWLLENDSHEVHLAKEACILHRNSKSHEWFMWRVKVATAEYYVRLLSENVKKGQKEKIAQGWLPTKPPPGYKTIGEKGHKTHVVDENKKLLAIKMFQSYATGNYSLEQLTGFMYKEGLRNENGNKIVKSRIHALITDPFYIGKITWNGQEYAGNHETFIDQDTFNKVEQILKSKTTPKYRKHNFLLQGMFRCGECTGTITWEIHKGIIYGHCNGYRECSQKVWYKEEAVQDLLSEQLSKLEINNTRLVDWVRKALKEANKNKTEYHSTSLGELQKQEEQLNKRLDKLYIDSLDDKITRDTYNR